MAEEGDVGVIDAEALRNCGTGEVSHLVKPVCATRCCQVKAPHPDLHIARLFSTSACTLLGLWQNL